MKTKRTKKELKLIDVYAIATGSTIAGGLFIVPGLAAAEIGNSFILAYIVSAILVIPAMLSQIELATAMPRAGGVYYFLDRSLGPLVGTIGGIGVWLLLILKVSFALIGIGAYLNLFLTNISITPIAISLAFLLGIINYFGSKKSSYLQIVLVSILLIILLLFVSTGFTHIEAKNFNGIMKFNFFDLMSTAGLVFVSYIGVTKVASISEEIENPERNIPLGLFLSLLTALILYILATVIIVGVLPINEIKGNLTAPASVEKVIFSSPGVIIISIAAIVSFISVANSGIMSASRYPLAMSRDNIIPASLRELTKFGTPSLSLYMTVALITIVLLIFDPTRIAKLASTFQLLVFAFICLAVIIMRESRLPSYDPGYKSPLYPWMQIIGIIFSLFLITQLGLLSILFSIGLIILGFIWYWYYSRSRVLRTGAIYHIFERLGKLRYEGLDSELRGILKEKGLRKEDPFEDIVNNSKFIDVKDKSNFEYVLQTASEYLSKEINCNVDEIVQQITDGTKIGATPVTHGFALPHFRSERIEQTILVLVRCLKGVEIQIFDPISHKAEDPQMVKGLFFLISPEKNPSQHLRILAKIAERLDDEDFLEKWNSARGEEEIKEALIFDEESLNITILRNKNSSALIGAEIKKLDFPKNCLITNIRRYSSSVIPKGDTVLMEFDKLIIIGDSKGIKELRKKYAN